MTTRTFQVASYKVKLGRELGIGGTRHYGLIACYGNDGSQLLIYFQRPDSADLSNVFFTDRKLGRIVVPAAQFPWYVDLLRNETPVYGYMNSDHPEWNQLRTDKEPVGEEES